MSQNKKTEIDWNELAPRIIDDVAHELMSNRFNFSETDIELRFGNRGSFCVNKRMGAFRDYEAGVHGGLLDMICHLCGFERKCQAIHWLQDKGFLDGTFTPTQRPRPTARNTTRPHSNRDMFKEGQKLWSEATPIPFYQQHPVRCWCRHRNLFSGYKELPPTIRWHAQRSLIIVALASIQDFIDADPEPPQPRQFHLISIDNEGRKGKAFRGDDKRTWGRPGVTCVALFGNPNAAEISICEGIADALAILDREEGAVIVSTTTFNKLTRCETLMEHLTANGRIVTLFGDNDTAGRDAQEKFAKTLYERDGEVFYHPTPTAKDPAEAAAMERKNE